MEKITIEEFKTRFLNLIAWGWTGETAARLTEKANTPGELAKVFQITKLVAFRSCLSLGDSLHYLISNGKI